MLRNKFAGLARGCVMIGEGCSEILDPDAFPASCIGMCWEGRSRLPEQFLSHVVLAEWMGSPRFRTFQVLRCWVFNLSHRTSACVGHELRGHTPPQSTV